MPMQSLQGSAVVRLFLALWLAITPTFVWAGSMTLLGVGKAGTTGVTLDPNNKGTNIVLSNGNLTASNSSGTTSDATARSTTSHSTGKFYFEVSITAVSRALIGIGNASANLNNFAGSNLNSVGVFFSLSGWFVNGSQLPPASDTYTAGDVVGFAVDLTNGLLWQRTNAGLWNNSGTDNPATTTGGFSLSGASVGAGPYFAMVSPADSATTLVANFGATAYAQTAPSGFGNW